MKIKRIKYISRFAAAMTADEIRALEEEAGRNNLERGITGVLMTSGGLFFQVIEGPAEEVDALYARILSDPRHTDIARLSTDLVDDRLFPDWGMKTMDLDTKTWLRVEPLRELLRALQQQREAMQTLSEFLQRAVWEELRQK